MKFGTIASGSSGNSLYVSSEDVHLLIDVGISKKRIDAGLNTFGIDGKDIQGILITHEHIDHIAGIGVMTRKYHMPIYSTEKTIRAILSSKSLGDLSSCDFHVIRSGEPFAIGCMEIEAFSISHDAADPVNYIFSENGKKIGTVTDLGYFDDDIVEHLLGSHLLYIEANHDIHMLQVGPYPYPLKQRILSNKGHLCNETAGRLICRLLHDDLRQIILGHLSKENNYPDLALETVNLEIEIKKRKNYDFDIFVAPRDEASQLIII